VLDGFAVEIYLLPVPRDFIAALYLSPSPFPVVFLRASIFVWIPEPVEGCDTVAILIP
jgi:hypothetical protein